MVGTPLPTPALVCQNQECGVELGCYVPGPDRKTWLQTGGLLIQSLHGVCAACGSAFHWSTTDLLFEELLKRIERNRRLLDTES